MSKHNLSKENTIQTAALGRPFRLGMLYDRHNDTVIPGESIVPPGDIANYVVYEDNQKGCDYQVVYGDSLESKGSIFEADANLKLNLLKGTVKAGSSGKFLKDHKTSNQKLRVSLMCNCLTHFKEIVIPKEMFKTSSFMSGATHVVVAIKYGANVVFVFERNVSNEENRQEIQGEMNGLVENIPGVSIDGTGKINWKENELQKADNMSCKFFGDMILPTNPTNYEEAVHFYKNLPSYLKKEDAAPVTVWLQPLPRSNENTIEHRIERVAMRQLEKTFEDLETIQITFNDLLFDMAAGIPQISTKIEGFRNQFRQFYLDFQGNLARILETCTIDRDQNITELLSRRQLKMFREWLSEAREEMSILNIYVGELKKSGIGISDSSTVEAKLFEHDDVIIMNIALPLFDELYDQVENLPMLTGSSQRQDKFIEQSTESNESKKGSAAFGVKLRKTAAPAEEPELKEAYKTRIVQEHRMHTERWYKSRDIKLRLRKMIKRLLKLEDSVVVVTVTNKKYETLDSCCTMSYFREGEEKYVDFCIPGPPGKLSVGMASENIINLDWIKPTEGYEFIEWYEVSYRKIDSGVNLDNLKENEFEWEQRCTPDRTETVRELEIEKDGTYEIKVRACCGHVFGNYSEVFLFTGGQA